MFKHRYRVPTTRVLIQKFCTDLYFVTLGTEIKTIITDLESTLGPQIIRGESQQNKIKVAGRNGLNFRILL